MRISEPVKTLTGHVARALPLAKWRRHDGLSSFLQDMVSLRKTLNLCASCESRMPRHWTDRYNYQFVRGFHAEAIACDRCRHDLPTNMYVATEGGYATQVRQERAALERIRRTERAVREGDRKYLLKVSEANRSAIL